MLKRRRKRLCLNQRPDFAAGFDQRPHVFGVKCVEHAINFPVEAVEGQELAEGVRRGCKTSGHLDAVRTGGQLRNHLAEAGVFSANCLNVAHSQFLKRYDQGGRLKKRGHEKTPEGLKAVGPTRWAGSAACDEAVALTVAGGAWCEGRIIRVIVGARPLLSGSRLSAAFTISSRPT